jgi:hypothetical protein
MNIGTLLIGAEGTKTPAGGRGRGDPTGASAPRRLPGPPAESEVPGVEINRLILHSLHKIKGLSINDFSTVNVEDLSTYIG